MPSVLTQCNCNEHDLESGGVSGETLAFSRAAANIHINDGNTPNADGPRRHAMVVPFVWNPTNRAKWLSGPAPVSMYFTKTASQNICPRIDHNF